MSSGSVAQVRSAVRAGRPRCSASARQARSPNERPRRASPCGACRSIGQVLVERHDLQRHIVEDAANIGLARSFVDQPGNDLGEVHREHDAIVPYGLLDTLGTRLLEHGGKNRRGVKDAAHVVPLPRVLPPPRAQPQRAARRSTRLRRTGLEWRTCARSPARGASLLEGSRCGAHHPRHAAPSGRPPCSPTCSRNVSRDHQSTTTPQPRTLLLLAARGWPSCFDSVPSASRHRPATSDKSTMSVRGGKVPRMRCAQDEGSGR